MIATAPTYRAPAWRGWPNKQMIKRIAKSVAWIQIKSHTVVIPNADVRALNTDPYEIIPSQGGKTLILPMFFVLTVDWATVPFTAPNTFRMAYNWASNDLNNHTIFWNDLANINNWVPGGSSTWLSGDVLADRWISIHTTAAPLVWDADLEVTTYYIVHENA